MAPLLQDRADLDQLTGVCQELTSSPTPSQTPAVDEPSGTPGEVVPDGTALSGVDSQTPDCDTPDRDTADGEAELNDFSETQNPPPIAVSAPSTAVGQQMITTATDASSLPPYSPAEEDFPPPYALVPSPTQVHVHLHNLPPQGLDVNTQDLHVHLQGLNLGESQDYPQGAWEGAPGPRVADPYFEDPPAVAPELGAVPGQVIGTIEDFHALVSAGMVLPAPGSETQGPMVFWGPDHEGRFIGGPANLLPAYLFTGDKTANWGYTQPEQWDVYSNYGYEEYYSEPTEVYATPVEDVDNSRTRRNSVDSGHADSDFSVDNASLGFETTPDGLCDTDIYETTPKGHYVDCMQGYYSDQVYGYPDEQCYYVPELQQGVLYTTPGWGVVEQTPCYIAAPQPTDTAVPYWSYQTETGSHGST